MGERGRRRRVGEVVGRYVDRLHRGDRALTGRGNTLLQIAHVGGQGGLIADRRGNAPQKCRDFGPGLGKAEDIVDEEQNVLALFVTEVFGQGQPRQANPSACPWRLVHLAVDEGRLGAGTVELDDAGIDHLMVEVVALAGALADAGEH